MKIVKRILKIAAMVFAAILLLIVGYYGKAYYSTEKRAHTKYNVTPEKLEIRTDSAMLTEGSRLAAIKGCKDCHSPDLGGKIFIDHPLMGRLSASNLTKGDGGLPQDHETTDWVLALKHGIGRDLTPLLVMPSHKFATLTEQDMAAIIAYCSTLPPVDRQLPENSIGPLARVLADQGQIELFPAELIDHQKPFTKQLKAGVSLSYGKYLANSCTGCHKENLQGGKPLAEGQPAPSDISSSGNPGRWTDEQFITTLRTGATPEGKNLDPAFMPWTMTKNFTDTELKAIHLYLKSL